MIFCTAPGKFTGFCDADLVKYVVVLVLYFSPAQHPQRRSKEDVPTPIYTHSNQLIITTLIICFLLNVSWFHHNCYDDGKDGMVGSM